MQSSPTSQDNKSARLSCRVRPSVKAQAEAAAQLLGLSITEFAETALEEKARHVMTEHERVLVSVRAFEAFVEAISSTPEKPTEKLLAAVAAYHEHSSVTMRS